MVPSFKETDLVVEWQSAPGASLPAMNRVTTSLMQDLRAIAGVRNVAAHVGRAVLSNEVTDVDAAEAWVSIDPAADYDESLEAVRKVVAAYPGLKGEVNTFLSKRMKERLTGGDQTLTVRIYGHDQSIVQSKANEIRELIAKVKGIENARVEPQTEKTTIEVKVDLDKARGYGLKPGDVRRAASTLVSGITVGALFQEQKVFDVVVLGRADIRRNINDVRNLLIDTPAGGQVRLSDVADVRTVAAPGVIRRQGVSRRIDIDADVAAGEHIADVSQEVARRVKEVSFPFEYHAQVIGEHFAQHEALRSLYSYFVAAALVVFLLLQAAFGSWRLALLSLTGVPIALLGCFLAILADGGDFTLGSLLGLITVLGLGVRNAVVLVRHLQRLELEGESFGEALVRRGVRERFPAIVASLLTTAVLMLPFVVFGDVAGLEIIHATAVVVLGGLATVAVLTLVCVPALYLPFGARSAPDSVSVAAELAKAAPVPQP